jgi:hypothetical protein
VTVTARIFSENSLEVSVAAIQGTSTNGTPAVGGENSAVIQADNTNWPAAGVSGTATQNGVGVVGFGNTGIGVWGHSKSGTGVGGVSDTALGVQGICNGSAVGVQGNSSAGTGVAGYSDNFRGVYGHSKANAGVVGESDNFDGVFGIAHNLAKAAVSGHNPGGLAGFFDGNVSVTGDVLLTGADCAEDFDVCTDADIAPGTVMVLDQDGKLRPCGRAYDKRVAGVISGAGDYKPGLVLDKRAQDLDRKPLALVGKTFCAVDASYEAIEIGDLLTTSDTLGHAMKAVDSSQAFGAVVGKALRPLRGGCALIPILIALQ